MRSRRLLALIHVRAERFCFGQHRVRCDPKVAIERGNAARAAPLMDKSGVRGPAGVEAIPRDVMKRAHKEKLGLCNALENIADALPSVDRLKRSSFPPTRPLSSAATPASLLSGGCAPNTSKTSAFLVR
ncbi:hypothetical protein [Mesorhizobium caraganae]|uniref:hypothetical protein n=1 Tax=Mesorhizobium caraganae TaxID=483206 RepID=UPI001FEEDEB5|nr:hypothetical protein [Mesorhizobium caraganae]